jgi:phage shock protein B
MSGVAAALFVPAVLFMIFVAPVWVVMHYRSLNRSSRVLNDDERGILEDMLATQDKLAERIVSLEAILDLDHPNWRQHERVRGVNNG